MTGFLPLFGLTPFTMLDFPGYTACIIWSAGCNMRCSYCHNPQIVKGKAQTTKEEVLGFLYKRRGLLDGVVLSGGEVTLWPGTIGFIKEIKKLGFKIKIDTNGTRPNVVRALLEDNLIDYVALDYKAPAKKFKAITGSNKYMPFTETLELLCSQKKVPFEVRTTVHTSILTHEDVSEIMSDLEKKGFRGEYYIQNFRSNNNQTILGMLPKQTHELDISSVQKPKNFEVKFRNYA